MNQLCIKSLRGFNSAPNQSRCLVLLSAIVDGADGAGRGSDMTVLSVPLSVQATKKTAIDGVVKCGVCQS